MKKIESGSLAVMLDEETLGLRIEKDGVVWNTDPKKTALSGIRIRKRHRN